MRVIRTEMYFEGDEEVGTWEVPAISMAWLKTKRQVDVSDLSEDYIFSRRYYEGDFVPRRWFTPKEALQATDDDFIGRILFFLWVSTRRESFRSVFDYGGNDKFYWG
jgi:hypothetical protein